MESESVSDARFRLGERWKRTIIPNPRAVAVSVMVSSYSVSSARCIVRGGCASLVKLGDAAIGRERVFRAERSPDLCVCVYWFGVIRTSFPRNQGLTLAERGGLTMHARQKLIPLKLPLSTMSSMTCGSTNISSSIKKKIRLSFVPTRLLCPRKSWRLASLSSSEPGFGPRTVPGSRVMARKKL